MQLTVFYKDTDSYLIDKLENHAKQDRKSRSALIMTILESFFEGKLPIGEILKDQGAVSEQHLEQALSIQEQQKSDELLGEILIKKGFVSSKDITYAINIQDNYKKLFQEELSHV